MLATSGAIAFVFKYGIRLAVLESQFQDLSKVAAELGRLPSIEANIKQMDSSIKQIVELLRDQVPRVEMDARFSDYNRRLEVVEQRN